MSKKNEFTLRPGLGVELVFNLESLSPVSKPSIIFECDEKENQLIVAQPVGKISPDYSFTQMHVSTLVSKDFSDKTRIGYQCKILDYLKGYKLANKGTADALLIEYFGPLIDINIRSAYRFQPNIVHDVMGKIIYKGKEYYSGIHFKVFNISITGLGILIPKKIKKEWNPLLEIEKNASAKIGLLLKKTDSEEEIITIESEIKVIRVNTNYNEKSGFAGISFINFLQQNEEALNKFIHSGQLHEIRAANKL